MRKKHNERGAGRKSKFCVPSERIIIPSCLKEKINKLCEPYLYSEKEIIEKQIEQFYNRDKEKFTPYSQISQKNREVIVEILNNK